MNKNNIGCGRKRVISHDSLTFTWTKTCTSTPTAAVSIRNHDRPKSSHTIIKRMLGRNIRRTNADCTLVAWTQHTIDSPAFYRIISERAQIWWARTTCLSNVLYNCKSCIRLRLDFRGAFWSTVARKPRDIFRLVLGTMGWLKSRVLFLNTLCMLPSSCFVWIQSFLSSSVYFLKICG